MTGMSDGLRIALTLGFVLVGGFCLWRCADLSRSRSWGDRIGYGAHTLMCASMLAMAWLPPVLVGWQIAVFALACGWFVIRALGLPATSVRLSTEPVTPVALMAHADLGGRLRCLHHAVLMAVMVWMFRVLSGGSMAMPGMPRSSGAAGPTRVLAIGGTVYAVLVAGLLTVAALAASRRAAGGTKRDDAMQAVMTAATAGMLVVMA